MNTQVQIANKPNVVNPFYLTSYEDEILASLVEGVPTIVTAGCGCGKSHLIKKWTKSFQDQGKAVVITAPYRDNKEDYAEVSKYAPNSFLMNSNQPNFIYSTDMVINMMNMYEGTKPNLNDLDAVKEHLVKLADEYTDTLHRELGDAIIFMDEYDFVQIQMNKTNTSDWFTASSVVNSTIKGEVLMLFMIKALAKKFTVIGLSGTRYALDDASIEFSDFAVTDVTVDIESTVTFDSWTDAFCPSDKGQQLQALEHNLMISIGVVLVQATKYSVKHLELFSRVAEEGKRTIMIMMLADKLTISKTDDGDRDLTISALGFNFCKTVDDIVKHKVNYCFIDNPDNDIRFNVDNINGNSLYDFVDVVAINTSNTRTVSIKQTHAILPTIINVEKGTITSNTVQTPPRFRNQPVTVINLINIKEKQAEVTLKTMEYHAARITERLNHISPNHHRYMKGNVPAVELVTYKASSTKGKNIGKAIGKSVSPKTIAKQQALESFLKDNPNGSYPLYCSMVPSELQYNRNKFGEAKKF